jgi:hypothetical protein
MSNKIKIKNHTQKNTSEEYNKQHLLWVQSNASFDYYMWTVRHELKFNDAPDLEQISKDYNQLTKLAFVFRLCIENSDLSEEKKDYYINEAANKYNQCANIFVKLCELKGKKTITLIDDEKTFKEGLYLSTLFSI